jgi:hypothetical protein
MKKQRNRENRIDTQPNKKTYTAKHIPPSPPGNLRHFPLGNIVVK